MYTAIEDIWCRWCLLMMRTRMEIDIDIERNAGIMKGVRGIMRREWREQESRD